MDIFKGPIAFICEDKEYYYIRPKFKDGEYDDTVWKVNRKTGDIEYMDYTEFIDIEDKTRRLSEDEYSKVKEL